ncbi:MAG TPA: helix-turn-helix domain-containing protein [Castellaniella sp.]|nr:helix-turn-helix domain-containing protein [Castellaniella sp.]
MDAIQAMVHQLQHARPIISLADGGSAYDRFLAIERVEAGERPSVVARDFGVKKCTVQRWCWEARQAQK